MSVKFEDNSMKIKSKLEAAAIRFLHEASGELVSQTARNTPVDTGHLKGSWEYKVDEGKLESMVGSPLENAIWNEFGTGEHALNGDGRKGGWVYQDRKGEYHFTRGKKPNRTLHNAFEQNRAKIERRAAEVLKDEME